jgi:anti-sigma regulatory factor (Ser/Thr protein kinase)
VSGRDDDIPAGHATLPVSATPLTGQARGCTRRAGNEGADEGEAIVLVRHEIADAVEVFVVTGPVGDGDVEALQTVLRRALSLNPRGIVVDVAEAGPFSPAALEVLTEVRRDAPGWPRPALVLAGASPGLAAQVDLPVHAHRSDAIAHVDDRSAAPRRRFDVEHDVHSPSAARAQTARAVGDLQIEPLTDELQLVVSELVTNAVRYADPPVAVEIEAGERTVTVAVGDGTPGRPQAKPPDLHAEGGRGLLMIDLLAADSGVRPQPPGKTIWASLARPAAESRDAGGPT